MMKYSNLLIQALVTIGLSWAFGSVMAAEAERTAELERQFEKVCLMYGGHFEQGWRYNDQGLQWGKRLTCAAGSISITCEGDSCAATRREIPGDRPVMDRDAKTTGILKFSPRVRTFDRILAKRAYE